MTKARVSKKIVLVLSVGSTPEPGVASIKHHRPNHVVFFASQESNKKTVPRILEAVPEYAAVSRVVLLDPEAEFEFGSSYTTALEAVRAALEFEPKTIKVDITGGTKPMTAALALAASDQDLEFSYVDGDRDAATGRVISGTERVRDSMKNPLRVFRVRELERVRLEWNDARFLDARTTLDGLLARQDLKRFERTLFESLKGIAIGFEAWDAFDHALAAEAFSRVLPRFGDVVSDSFSQLEGFYAQVKLLEQDANALAQDSRHTTQAKLEDVLANAARRALGGRYEDGLARLIRAFEMHLYLELNAAGFGGTRARTGSGSYLREFAEALPDHVVSRAYGPDGRGELKEFYDARNRSLVGHGSNPVPPEVYQDFEALLEQRFGLRKPEVWRWPELPALV